MAINAISNTVRSAMCDAFVDALDTGTTDAGGDILIYNAGYALLLAEPQFGNPAFGAASSGVATANAITDDSSANNAGTANVGRFQNRDNTAVADFTVGSGAGDLDLNTVSISAGDTVSITSATITMPAA